MKKYLLVFLLNNISSILGYSQVPNLEWANRMGSTSFDRPEDITVDATGNVYTIGFFTTTADFDPGAGVLNLTSAGGRDVFITKFDPNGNLIWAKQLGGTGDDQGFTIAIDNTGNIYLAGHFQGTVDFDPGPAVFSLTASGLDMFLVKLEATGNFLWANRTGSAAAVTPFDMAIDNTGNIHITGYFNGTVDFDPRAGVFNLTTAGTFDIFVTKLNTNGELIWAKRMGSTQLDEGRAITVDGNGNVYTTGYFRATVDFDPGVAVFNLTSVANEDIFISKLDVNGNFVWAVAMGGSSFDVGQGIFVDASNVYATGYFQGTADFDPSVSVFNLISAGVQDVFVSKFDLDGNLVWAKNMGGTARDDGSDIAVDASGNVYTTGFFTGTADFDPGAGVVNQISAGGLDIFISKLTAAGDFEWVRRIGGSDWDQGVKMKTDGLNNIYVTGQFRNNVDFDPGPCNQFLNANAQDEIFVLKLRQQPLVGDPSITSFSPLAGNTGSTVIISGINFSPVTSNNIVYFNGLTTTVTASSITSITTTVPAAATTGKLTVITGCIGTQSSSSFIIGTPGVPTITSFAPGSGPVGASVTITGTNFGPTAASNTVTFNGIPSIVTAGTTTSITTTVPVGATTGPISVTVAGNTAISSSSFTVTTSSTTWLRKIGNAGTQTGDAIAIDGLGNSYTCGTFSGTTDFDPGVATFELTAQSSDAFVVKLNSDGEFIWAQKIGGLSVDEAHAIQVDASGNIIVGGIFSGTVDFDPGAGTFNITSVGARDLFILKLDNNGNFVWAKSISGPGGSKDISSIALDVSGNIYATGYFSSTADFDPGTSVMNLTSNGSFDAFLLKLDNSGNFLWAKQAGSTGVDVGEGVTLNAAGHAHLIGSFTGTVDFDPGAGITNLTSLGNSDVFITKYDADGNLLWAKSIGSTSTDYGYALTADAGGNIYATGVFANTVDFDPDTGIFNLTAGSQPAFVLKLASNGTFVWASQFGGPHGDTKPHSITLDASGTIYVLGDAFDGDDGSEIILAGMDYVGSIIFIDVANGFGTGSSLVMDPSGNIHATGKFSGSVDFNLGGCQGTIVGNGYDIFILKMQPEIFTRPTITSFSPTFGVAGTSITITGTNFSLIPSDIVVEFNGKPALVTASTATTVTTTVPLNATTGRISVSVACRTTTSAAVFTVGSTPNQPPRIQATTISVSPNGLVNIDLLPMLSDPDDNLDLSTLSLLSTTTQMGAPAALIGETLLEVDYTGIFSGTDQISITVCDSLNACTEEVLFIVLSDEIKIYNAVSPNNDGRNDFFKIENIELLEPQNTVTIYNRWGSKVFEVKNYSDSNAFRGLNQNGNELPSGTYFYKILLNSSGKILTGYLVIKN